MMHYNESNTIVHFRVYRSKAYMILNGICEELCSSGLIPGFQMNAHKSPDGLMIRADDDGEVILLPMQPKFNIDDFKDAIGYWGRKLLAVIAVNSPVFTTVLYDEDNLKKKITLCSELLGPVECELQEALCLIHCICYDDASKYFSQELIENVIGAPFDPIVQESLKKLRAEGETGNTSAAAKHHEIFTTAFFALCG